MILGLIKRAGEEATATIKEWLGTEYIANALFAAVNLALEEFTNAFVRSSLGLTGIYDTVYKIFHRILWSGITYFGFKKLGYPAFAVIGSIIPITLIGVDAINYLLKKTPEQAGHELGLRLSGWASVARVSAVTPAPTPAPSPAPAEATPTPTAEVEVY